MTVVAHTEDNSRLLTGALCALSGKYTYFTRKPDAECVSAAIISISEFEEVLGQRGALASLCARVES